MISKLALVSIRDKDGDRSNCRDTNLTFKTPSKNILGAVARGHRGVNRWNAIFTENDIRAIRSMRSNGIQIKEIAGRFMSSQGAIYHITLGHNWRHVA